VVAPYNHQISRLLFFPFLGHLVLFFSLSSEDRLVGSINQASLAVCLYVGNVPQA
jgi:hypothetical protein